MAHVGIYCGSGKIIECTGSSFYGPGMVQSTITGDYDHGYIKNGVIEGGNQFTEWFYDVNLQYPSVINAYNLIIYNIYHTDRSIHIEGVPFSRLIVHVFQLVGDKQVKTAEYRATMGASPYFSIPVSNLPREDGMVFIQQFEPNGTYSAASASIHRMG